jgi:hypothetical protein
LPPFLKSRTEGTDFTSKRILIMDGQRTSSHHPEAVRQWNDPTRTCAFYPIELDGKDLLVGPPGKGLAHQFIPARTIYDIVLQGRYR